MKKSIFAGGLIYITACRFIFRYNDPHRMEWFKRCYIDYKSFSSGLNVGGTDTDDGDDDGGDGGGGGCFITTSVF